MLGLVWKGEEQVNFISYMTNCIIYLYTFLVSGKRVVIWDSIRAINIIAIWVPFPLAVCWSKFVFCALCVVCVESETGPMGYRYSIDAFRLSLVFRTYISA
ncbi:hypothetical protein CPC08DRAFT_28498 [Agrocybe pediades]|nr:hypothetical protein CPC08DRAFT_28498 [Agrocybe pediades]